MMKDFIQQSKLLQEIGMEGILHRSLPLAMHGVVTSTI